MFKRRDFIKSLGLTSAAWLGMGDTVFAGIKKELPILNFPSVFNVIRIKGRVSSGGKGLSGVAVSDGRLVVQTSASGEFELISGNDRDFVFVSLPAGFEIPRQANGSAAFFQRIDKTKAEQSFQFELKRSSASDDNHHFLLLSDTQIQDDYDAGQLLTVAAPDVQKTVANLNDPNLF